MKTLEITETTNMNRYSFDYSHKYSPPAPIIDVRLRSPYAVSTTVPALVDSGATM